MWSLIFPVPPKPKSLYEKLIDNLFAALETGVDSIEKLMHNKYFALGTGLVVLFLVMLLCMRWLFKEESDVESRSDEPPVVFIFKHPWSKTVWGYPRNYVNNKVIHTK